MLTTEPKAPQIVLKYAGIKMTIKQYHYNEASWYRVTSSVLNYELYEENWKKAEK